LIQDYDPALPNYGAPADYPGRINVNYANARLPVDRIHINSVAYNPALDQIMLSAHYYSEIWVIDHAMTSETAAGPAGDLRYRWGNPAAYGRGGTADRQLFFQHHAHWLANGDILVFNNGMPIFRPYSSVDAITPPLHPDGHYALPDSAAYGPEASIQQYNPPERFYSSAFGGAQTLPDGHLFITQGTVGRIFEVDAAGEVVWEYFVPIFTFPSNVNRSSIFRAQRILPDDPALAGRNLTPGDVIPLTLPDDSTGG
ncbi:MAG: arylsulfotransferase family protein, partial [Anaerolineae bacterium]|nr:arylsulfotransferase family protein [Anaerolineae bacterium]